MSSDACGCRQRPAFPAYLSAVIANRYIGLPSFLACLFLASCTEHSRPVGMTPGQWSLAFPVNDSISIPVRLSVDSAGGWVLYNWTEQIPLEALTWAADSFHVKLPLFNSSLHGRLHNDTLVSGYWQDHSRQGQYRVDFTGSPAAFADFSAHHPGDEGKRYRVTFNPDVDSLRYPSVALLHRSGSNLSGTFMTETGDYRFLQGTLDSTRSPAPFYLSCFDGTHLFHFTGSFERGDSVISRGLFYSGNHSVETWEARHDDAAALTDPDSLTYVTTSGEPLRFSVTNSSGMPVTFDVSSLKGKVTLVQLHGTWCPNCTDESVWLGDIYRRYNSRGLQVIPVAFERNGGQEDLLRNVARQFRQLNLPYASYLGGEKHMSNQVFPMLNAVMSYPTLLVVDRKGVVRKIHTGFYGPGTGRYYQHYTSRLELFITQLLEEPA